MIHLDEKYLIGKGEKRSCYQLPSKESFCIKVAHKEGKRVHKNIEREINYLQKYSSKIRLPKYFGQAETNLGKGYIFERIRDWDGKTSVTLTEYSNNNENAQCIQTLLTKMYHSFLFNRIIVSDFHSGNLLINKETPEDKPKLILIDGIGNTDYIKICDYSKFFLKKKLIRKFKRLLKELGLPDSSII